VFAAQGFEVAPVPAGETRAPQRDLPVAIVLSLVAASLLYVVVQLVLVASGANLSLESDTPLVAAALSVAPALAFVVVLGGLVSTLGFVSGSALGTPRYLFAAAADRHLPAALGAVHPRFGSPHIAIAVTAALAMALVVSFDYRSLIGISNVAVAVQYLAPARRCRAAARRRAGTPDPGWRARAGARRRDEPVDLHRGLARGAHVGGGRARGRRCGARAAAPGVIVSEAEDLRCPIS
jgi:APA family basic amino acid/polyamine antiporter